MDLDVGSSGRSSVYDRLRTGRLRRPPRHGMEYHIRQYGLRQGALEIEYIEEHFGEFPRKKTASEVICVYGNAITRS